MLKSRRMVVGVIWRGMGINEREMTFFRLPFEYFPLLLVTNQMKESSD